MLTPTRHRRRLLLPLPRALAPARDEHGGKVKGLRELDAGYFGLRTPRC
jgi:hypothetical protein